MEHFLFFFFFRSSILIVERIDSCEVLTPGQVGVELCPTTINVSCLNLENILYLNIGFTTFRIPTIERKLAAAIVRVESFASVLKISSPSALYVASHASDKAWMYLTYLRVFPCLAFLNGVQELAPGPQSKKNPELYNDADGVQMLLIDSGDCKIMSPVGSPSALALSIHPFEF